MITVRDQDIGDAELARLQATLERDLIALMKQLEEDALRLVAKAEREGWSPEELIYAIEQLIEDDPRSMIEQLEHAEKSLKAITARKVWKAGFPTGTVSTWADGKEYRKQDDGSWAATGGEGQSKSRAVEHPADANIKIKHPSTATGKNTWSDPKSAATFIPGGDTPDELNGVAFSAWEPPDDWETVEGQADVGEPELPEIEDGERLSAGVVIEESDGRVWINKPTNEFGGYRNTFPKGGIDEGVSMQAGAIREAWEETGLKVEITGYLDDARGDTSTTRFYTARRTGGTPSAAGWETQAVSLVPRQMLEKYLNRSRDRAVAEKLRSKSAASYALSRIERDFVDASRHVSKGPKTEIGDVVNWAGTLYVRVDDKPGAGDKVNFRRLGKAPAGWAKGDALPDDMEKRRKDHLAGKTAKPEGKKPEGKKPEEKKPDEPKATDDKPLAAKIADRQKAFNTALSAAVKAGTREERAVAMVSAIEDRAALESIIEVSAEFPHLKAQLTPEMITKSLRAKNGTTSIHPKFVPDELLATVIRKAYRQSCIEGVTAARKKAGLGGFGVKPEITKGKTSPAAKNIRESAKAFPSNWKTGPLNVQKAKKGERAYFQHPFGSHSSGSAKVVIPAGGKEWPPMSGIPEVDANLKVQIAAQELRERSTATHEFAHAIEHWNDEVMDANREFFQRRCKGGEIRSLQDSSKTYSWRELYVKSDEGKKFNTRYMAKLYYKPYMEKQEPMDGYALKVKSKEHVDWDTEFAKNSALKYTFGHEFWTIGMENLYHDKDQWFGRDPELDQHIMGVLTTI